MGAARDRGQGRIGLAAFWLPVVLLALALVLPSAARAALPAELSDPGIPRTELAIRVVPLSEPELAQLAGQWFAIVQDAASRAATMQVDIADREDKPAARRALSRQIALRNGLLRNFMEVVDAWDRKGGDAGMVKKYRAWRNAVLIGGRHDADVRATVSRLILWLGSPDGGGRVAVTASVILLKSGLVVILAGLCGRAMQRVVDRSDRLSRVVRHFLVVAARWGVLIVGAVFVLSSAGLEVPPLYALLGGSSVIAALAFQDSLSNVAAGMMIMLVRPFDEGDVVEIAAITGRVRSVGLLATVVATGDNRLVLIPHRQTWGTVIINKSAAPIRRMDMTFRFASYEITEKAKEIALACLSQHPCVLKDPPPELHLTASEQRGIVLEVGPWARQQDCDGLEDELNSRLVAAFGRAGLPLLAPED